MGRHGLRGRDQLQRCLLTHMLEQRNAIASVMAEDPDDDANAYGLFDVARVIRCDRVSEEGELALQLLGKVLAGDAQGRSSGGG
jgi:hypothetical protein